MTVENINSYSAIDNFPAIHVFNVIWYGGAIIHLRKEYESLDQNTSKKKKQKLAIIA